MNKGNSQELCREIKLPELMNRIENGPDTTYVVNFWATWCKPCVDELPSFNALHKATQQSNVKVIMVSLDDPRQLDSKVIPFVKKLGYHLEFVLLNESKPHIWIDKIDSSWSGAIPATLIVNSGTRSKKFIESDFTADELLRTVSKFRKLNND